MRKILSLLALFAGPLGLSAQCDGYTDFVPCDETIEYIDYRPWEAGDDAGLWCLPSSRCTYSCPTRPSAAQIYHDLGHLCHKNRYPSEYTPEQWRTIMLHMRVIQPMTACNHRMVLNFLQDKRPHVEKHVEVSHEEENKTAQKSDSLTEIIGPLSRPTSQMVPSGFAGYISKFNYVFTGFMFTSYIHPFPSFFGDLDGNNSFYYDFDPVFLASYGDNILMASRLSISNFGQSAVFRLTYAYLAYVYNDYVTFQGGKFIIPFGIAVPYFTNAFTAKLYPPNYVFPFSIAPFLDIGFQVRGAIPLCQLGEWFYRSNFTYELFIGNGASEVNAFTGSAQPNGSIFVDNANAPNNNNEFAWGGRLAFCPNDLQCYGVSYQRGRWSSNKVAFSADGLGKKRVFEAAAFDMNINLDQSTTLRGEYVWTQYEGNLAEFPWVRQTAYWIELSVGLDHIAWLSQDIYCWKPCLWDSMEFTMRSAQVWSQPSGATFLGFDYSGFDKKTFALGLSYYFTQTLRMSFQYDFNYGDGAHNFVRESFTGPSKKTGFNNNVFYLSLIYGW
jgi:hypothetical protein